MHTAIDRAGRTIICSTSLIKLLTRMVGSLVWVGFTSLDLHTETTVIVITASLSVSASSWLCLVHTRPLLTDTSNRSRYRRQQQWKRSMTVTFSYDI